MGDTPVNRSRRRTVVKATTSFLHVKGVPASFVTPTAYCLLHVHLCNAFSVTKPTYNENKIYIHRQIPTREAPKYPISITIMTTHSKTSSHVIQHNNQHGDSPKGQIRVGSDKILNFFLKVLAVTES